MPAGVANIIDPVVESSPPVRVYTPDSPIRRPRRFLAQIVSDFRSSRTLAWRLFVRDVSALYRQTALGYVGAVLPALVTSLVWILLNSSSYIDIKTGSIPYPVFVLTGTMFWQLFVDSMNAPLKQLSGNRSMLNRVNFPTEALLLSGFAQVLFAFAIRSVVLAAGIAIYRVPIEWTTVLLVFPVLAIIAIGTAVGVFLAPLGLLYKDVEQGLLMIVGPLMFLTPVVYPPPGGSIGRVMHFNPLTPSFTVIRDLLYGNAGQSVVSFVLVGVASVIAAGVAWVVYRLALPILVERFDA
jgi:lipopolysaccharide transport system permease protein